MPDTALNTSANHSQSARIEYIDALRGFTMILVVYSHIVNTVFHAQSPTNDLFIMVRMPLFFFISGFFAYTVFSRQLLFKRIKNRVFKQLLPTIVMFSAFCLIFGFNYKYNIFHQSKRGYWFTLVAVEYFFTYITADLAATYIAKITKARKNLTLTVLMLILIVAGQMIYYATRSDNPAAYNIVNALSLKLYALYLPFFFMGIGARMWFPSFVSFLQSRALIAISLVGFVTGYIFYLHVPAHLVGTLCSALGVITVFKIFNFYQEYLSTRTAIGACLCTIGKFTLEIYLLHYFIIRALFSMRGAPWIQCVNSSWLLQLIVFLTLSILVVGVCLLAAKIVKVSPPVYAVLFGKTQ